MGAKRETNGSFPLHISRESSRDQAVEIECHFTFCLPSRKKEVETKCSFCKEEPLQPDDRIAKYVESIQSLGMSGGLSRTISG